MLLTLLRFLVTHLRHRDLLRPLRQAFSGLSVEILLLVLRWMLLCRFRKDVEHNMKLKWRVHVDRIMGTHHVEAQPEVAGVLFEHAPRIEQTLSEVFSIVVPYYSRFAELFCAVVAP